MYVVILSGSIVLLLTDAGRHPTASVLMLFSLPALYACLSVIPLGNLTLPIFEAGSLFEPRVFELLS
jgi:hypothetical protein